MERHICGPFVVEGNGRTLVDELNCFSCKHPLSEERTALMGEHFVTTCPSCRVVNKLSRSKENTEKFVVSGAFFVVPKPDSG